MKKDIFLILLSSALLIFSFPNFNFWLLAWFGFIPLLFAIQNKSKFKAFSLFYLTGVIFWLGTVYWLIHVTALGMILLVLYLALYFGIFGLIVSQAYILPTTYYLLFIPSIWVLLEYLRNHLFSGFGWALLGYSQYLNLAVIQIADTSGVYGVSFLVMTINVAIKQIIGFSQGSAKIKALKWPLVISLSMLAAAFFYGYLRVNKIEHQRPYGSLKVAVIQGNIPQRLKWRSVAKGYIMQEYLGLSRQASRDKPDLMIWPEAALPVIIQEEPGFLSRPGSW